MEYRFITGAGISAGYDLSSAWLSDDEERKEAKRLKGRTVAGSFQYGQLKEEQQFDFAVD